MKKFAAGILLGGAMTAAGVGYLMMDRHAYHKMVRKSKHAQRQPLNDGEPSIIKNVQAICLHVSIISLMMNLSC
jgi:glucokinase